MTLVFRTTAMLSVCFLLGAVSTQAGATASRSRTFFTNENMNSGKDACLPDFRKFCPGQEAKNGAMKRCLAAYQSSVSSACAPILSKWCSAGGC